MAPSAALETLAVEPVLSEIGAMAVASSVASQMRSTSLILVPGVLSIIAPSPVVSAPPVGSSGGLVASSSAGMFVFCSFSGSPHVLFVVAVVRKIVFGIFLNEAPTSFFPVG